MNERDHNQHQRNIKHYKNILWATICQQIRQSGRNGCIPKNILSTKTETRRNKKKSEHIHNLQRNWISTQKSPNKQESRANGFQGEL